MNKTPQRVKLLDAFMAFLAVVGALQFVYCVIVGNFVSLLLTLLDWRIGKMGFGKEKGRQYGTGQ